MNVFFKAYCRIFQGAFRLVLPILPYRDPKILKNMTLVPAAVKDEGLNKPLIVTDGFLSSSGVMDPLISAFNEENVAYSMFDGVVANPTTETVAAALEMYKKDGCDCIVAFGGGSPMDTAKAVGACIARPKKKLGDMAGVIKVRKKLPFLVAVPTTCGTGSETTIAAVIVDAETRHKYAIEDFSLIPDVAVLDGSTVRGLPPKLVAYTGLDALTHAVEAYIGRSTTKSTRSDALEAMRIIFNNIVAAFEGDESARSEMLYASHLAGRAFSKSYVGYVHALAHPLGGKYNVAHGLANAVILPHVLKEYGKAIHKKLKKAAVFCGLCKSDATDEEGANAFLAALDKVEGILDIPRGFDCINRDDIKELAHYAAKEANPLYPVPVLWDEDKLAQMYESLILQDDNG